MSKKLFIRKHLNKIIYISVIVAIIAAIAIVLCTGDKGKTGETKFDYDKDFVKTIEELGNVEINSIDNFKDGDYRCGFPEGVSKVTKEGNTLNIQYTGTINAGGESYGVGIAKLEKKYKSTALYSISNIEVSGMERFMKNSLAIKSHKDLVDKLKNGTINKEDVTVRENTITLKVIDDKTILVDDIEFTRIEYKEVEKPSLEELQKQEEETRKNIEALVGNEISPIFQEGGPDSIDEVPVENNNETETSVENTEATEEEATE